MQEELSLNVEIACKILEHTDPYTGDALTNFPGDPRFPWGIDVDFPAIDVETIALRESGHSSGMLHFGPPPDAIMNEYLYERRQSLYPIDIAGMYAVWESWPK
jgi:hypothetical protein